MSLKRRTKRATPRWQCEKEGSAMAKLALYPHCSTVILDNVLHDREAKAGAAGFARARRIYPVKAFEESRVVLVRNSFPEIAHIEFHHLAVGSCSQLDLPTGLAILQRILDQVAEHLLDGVAVAAD